MKFGLNDKTIELMQSVLKLYPSIDKAIIYGSRAKGNYKNGSDIDLCVFSKDLDQKTLYRIETALEDLDLPYAFDICLYQSISNQDLKEHIDRVGILLYESHNKKLNE